MARVRLVNNSSALCLFFFFPPGWPLSKALLISQVLTWHAGNGVLKEQLWVSSFTHFIFLYVLSWQHVIMYCHPVRWISSVNITGFVMVSFLWCVWLVPHVAGLTKYIGAESWYDIICNVNNDVHLGVVGSAPFHIRFNLMLILGFASGAAGLGQGLEWQQSIKWSINALNKAYTFG